jgi:hypothetical protein
MTTLRRRGIGLAIAALAIGVASGCGDGGGATTTTSTTGSATSTAPSTSTNATAEVADPSRFRSDALAAASSLQAVGTALQSTSSLDDLKAKLSGLRGSLDRFDQAIGRMAGYTLADATLEQQRSGLARTGPRVSRLIRRFIDAAQRADLAKVRSLAPQIASALQDFATAATPSASP